MTGSRTETAKLEALTRPPFKFDRYINGELMAEGVTIEHDVSTDKAMREAARIASRGPNGETTVLVLRQAATDISTRALSHPAVRPLEWHKSNVSDRWTAAHPFGSYEIVLNKRDVEYWSPQFGGLGQHWGSLQEAQSAIQSEHVAAILSALTKEKQE